MAVKFCQSLPFAKFSHHVFPRVHCVSRYKVGPPARQKARCSDRNPLQDSSGSMLGWVTVLCLQWREINCDQVLRSRVYANHLMQVNFIVEEMVAGPGWKISRTRSLRKVYTRSILRIWSQPSKHRPMSGGKGGDGKDRGRADPQGLILPLSNLSKRRVGSISQGRHFKINLAIKLLRKLKLNLVFCRWAFKIKSN